MILKTITFNMAHGRGLDGKVDVKRQANVIKKYNPDIVFLQEIDMYTKRANYANQIRFFTKQIGLLYCSMQTNIVLEEGFYGDGIISRWPIAFSTNYLMPQINKNNEQRGILRNKIQFGTTSLNLFSVHFPTNEEERILATKELVKIASKMTESSITIVAGDFNVGMTRLGKGNYIHNQKEKYDEYEMIKQVLNKIDNVEPTIMLKNSGACIDTIFYSNNAQLVKFKTIKGTYSDHNALYAEFNI